MRELPIGTVTLLFTDIEGSTRLLNEGGLAYEVLLEEHRRLLRRAFGTHGGVEVDTQGDAFFVAFARAPDAVAAAEDAQRALAGAPVSVRIGIHTGTPKRSAEGYVGIDVHRGARIAACGHGGQVLLSQETKALVGERFALTDLGHHRLKDLQDPEWIFQLGKDEFPPLKSLNNTNLPAAISSFVGRAAELRAVTTLLRSDARLVTLTGAGGSGKTRLAIEAARRVTDQYPNGVYWVALAPLRDAALVLETVAQTVGAKVELPAHFAGKRVLLLLDNFEHLVDAAPALGALLSACSSLDCIVTSREVLRLDGEREYVVAPMSDAEATTLFCERSRSAPSAEISELCLRLDRLPLAIELAAARTNVLSPGEIRERLGSRLDLLKGGRDAEGRHETLRATIEWSYDLLIEEEQRLFARLSIFAGGCTLESAEQVCDSQVDVLASLVDKSLIRKADGRFWMLDTIRQYAAERHESTGDAAELRRRHADWIFHWAAERDLRGADQDLLLVELRHELPNVRAALQEMTTSARHCDRLVVGTELAQAMFQLGATRESMEWLESALHVSGGCPRELRTRGLAYASIQATLAGDRDLGNRRATEATALVTEQDELDLRAHVLLARSIVELAEGNLEASERVTREALSHAEELGNASLLGDLQNNLSYIALLRGDFDLARRTAEAALAAARSSANHHLAAMLLQNLGVVALKRRHFDEAAAYLGEALEISRRLGLNEVAARSLEGIATIAVRRGAPVLAATLLATAARGPAPAAAEEELRREVEDDMRSLLGAEQFAEASAMGAALTLDDAAERATTWLNGAPGIAESPEP